MREMELRYLMHHQNALFCNTAAYMLQFTGYRCKLARYAFLITYLLGPNGLIYSPGAYHTVITNTNITNAASIFHTFHFSDIALYQYFRWVARHSSNFSIISLTARSQRNLDFRKFLCAPYRLGHLACRQVYYIIHLHIQQQTRKRAYISSLLAALH